MPSGTSTTWPPPNWRRLLRSLPTIAGLQVSLGDAYLNLGQDDKALAAFDRAIEISATPLVWNNIAYQLSLKNTHLDKAQQYAESAVAATAAGLRNLSLDQLNQRDLALVPSLIAYWDTLGWVFYAEGKLDKAEKYVSAAWGLGHHGEVGDHLGQIYEKRGEKEKAISTYALAYERTPPDSGNARTSRRLVGGDDKVDAGGDRNIATTCNKCAPRKLNDTPPAHGKCGFLGLARHQQEWSYGGRA